MTFNIDGMSLLERGETPDEALAKELGKHRVCRPRCRSYLSILCLSLSLSRMYHHHPCGEQHCFRAEKKGKST